MDPNSLQSLDCLASPDMNIQRSSTDSTGLQFVSLAEPTTRISAMYFKLVLYLQYRPIVWREYLLSPVAPPYGVSSTVLASYR